MHTRIITGAPSEATAAQWLDCLAHADVASHYASPAYLTEPYFRDIFAVLVYDEEHIVGVLTGQHRGSQIICGNSGSPQVAIRRDVDRAVVWAEFGEALRSLGADLTTVYAWEDGLRLPGFKMRECACPDGTILIDFAKGPDQLFKDFSDTSRNHIRRAIREGVEVSRCDLARDFDEYYRLYLDWSAFKGLPVQPREAQWQAFSDTDHRLVMVARYKGAMVGVSTFRYVKAGIMEYAANVSRRETSVKQNELLLWEAVKWGYANGLRGMSMGSAQLFSRKFGGEARSIYRYRLDRTFLRRHERREALLLVAVRAKHVVLRRA